MGPTGTFMNSGGPGPSGSMFAAPEVPSVPWAWGEALRLLG